MAGKSILQANIHNGLAREVIEAVGGGPAIRLIRSDFSVEIEKCSAKEAAAAKYMHV